MEGSFLFIFAHHFYTFLCSRFCVYLTVCQGFDNMNCIFKHLQFKIVFVQLPDIFYIDSPFQVQIQLFQLFILDGVFKWNYWNCIFYLINIRNRQTIYYNYLRNISSFENSQVLNIFPLELYTVLPVQYFVKKISLLLQWVLTDALPLFFGVKDRNYFRHIIVILVREQNQLIILLEFFQKLPHIGPVGYVDFSFLNCFLVRFEVHFFKADFLDDVVVGGGFFTNVDQSSIKSKNNCLLF